MSLRPHSGSEDSTAPGSRRDDEDDLAGLIERLGMAPVHLAGNSFGASIALGLAARRSELVRSVCGHEPPLLALATDDDPLIHHFQAEGHAVLTFLARGEPEAAARHFAEHIALGPGAWELMPSAERATMTANAKTFLDEQRDPEWATIDVDGLAALSRPVLLTQGDQSPPFFATIISQLHHAMPQARVETLRGAGHVPHVSHLAEWAAVVRVFLESGLEATA